jgi:hypothetical protein
MFHLPSSIQGYFYPTPVTTSIKDVNNDVVLEIFSRLNLKPKIACSQVNKNWEKLAFNSIRKYIIDKPRKRYRIFNSRLNNDRDVLLAMVKKNVGVLFKANKRFTNDKDFMLEAIKRNYRAIAFTDCEEIKNNKELMLKLIHKESDCFECASEDLKNDKEFLSLAISVNESIFRYASKEIQSDRQFILGNIIKNPKLFLYIEMNFFRDEQFL